jgi:hypothetical protein
MVAAVPFWAYGTQARNPKLRQGENHMTKQFSTLVVALGLAAGSSLMAQDMTERGTVPFEFQVGAKHLDAGTYDVSRAANGILTLHNRDSRTSSVAPMPISSGVNEKAESKLVFRKYGDRYFLAEVWFGHDRAGHALPPSKMEKEYALQLHVDKPEIIYLAMR